MPLASLIARRPGRVLAVGLALTLGALAVAAGRLRIETDLAALLPRDAPAAADYRAFLASFGGYEKVFVVVRPGGSAADAGTLIAAADRLAELLAASPEVAAARSGLSAEDQAFFFGHVAPRALLLADLPAAEVRRRLEPAALRARAAELRRLLTSPLGAAASELLAADPLGFAEGLLASVDAGLPLDPLSGGFLSPARDAALVVLTPARAEIDPEGGRALAAAIAAAARRVRRELGAPLRVDAAGGPLYAAQDETILRRDLSRTLGASTAGVGLALLAGFEGVVVPGAILVAVAAGLVWTGAFAALALGGLTGVGLGFTVALVGLGVEYGVHGGARFQAARLAGAAPAEALGRAFAEAGPGVVSSALTTAVALAALALSHFRPLREMGVVLTAGVLATLATTATLGAAALVLRRRPPVSGRAPGLWRARAQPVVEALVGLSARRPVAVLAAALALSAVAAAGLARLDLDADLRALRPADHPALAVERLLVERFGLGLDTATVVVRGGDLGEALTRAARARRALEAALGSGAQISSPSDWLAAGAARDARLRELAALPLARAADDLERELGAAGLNPRAFAPALSTLRAFARGEDPGAPPPDAWPDWLRELARAPEGGRGAAAVAVNLRLPLGRERAARAAVLRALAPLGPGVAFASVPRVGEELRRLALADLRRSSGLALLLVAAVVLASFRGRPGASALSALPLALGCLWTFGLWGAAGRPIDLLCIATLPVLFGTGIDLGVHTLHTARVHPAGVAGAARELGLAMTLTVATTGIGFGSLASSRVPGLRNAGLIVAAGVVLCLLATLTVLPALGALVDRWRGGAGARTGRPPRERPPHAPEIGRAHRLLGRFHFTRVFWYRIHRLGVIVVPQRLFAPGIAVFTLLFWIALRRVGAAVAANLEAVLGPAGFWRRQARIYRTLREFAWCLSERYERLALGREAEVALDGEATWRALLDSGAGFVLLTAHLGPWESGSMAPATRDRRSVHLVREAEPDAEVDRFVRGLLEAQAPGLHVTHFAADNPHLGAVLLDALRAGDIVALQGDRPRAGGRSLEAPLFGRPFPFPVGPAALARAAGVPIVPVFVLREGRLRYRSRVRPLIEVPRTADREADLRQAVAGYAAELEGAIRERPHQWFLFRKVWE